MKKILINANQQEEVRVALINNNTLENLDIENNQKKRSKTNIYRGTIKRIERSLEAAFVDYGSDRHGFLSFKEISPSNALDASSTTNSASPQIPTVESPVLVQINKEERGNKGAALSTFVSLAGCYLVLMPNTPKGGGISRRIQGNEREQLKAHLKKLVIPQDMSVILRTAAVGHPLSNLEWDLNVLIKQWSKIKEAASNCNGSALIYDENNILMRSLKDNLHQEIDEIIIDDKEMYKKACEYVKLLTPEKINIITLYQGPAPLFTHYRIEAQIKTAYAKEIRLPSGGSIIIDKTEALTSIDINSAKSTKGINIEETAFNTNLEAAKEISKQLKLRDIGGLIVIDFIDMNEKNNRGEVEGKLKKSIKNDRARIQIEPISRFGLLEMSRQRLGTSLNDSNQEYCRYCQGQGTLRNVESIALALLREIEEESLNQKTNEIVAQLPLELHSFLNNEKRNELVRIEKAQNIKIILIPNKYLSFPLYELKKNQLPNTAKTYNLIEKSSREQPLLSEHSQKISRALVKGRGQSSKVESKNKKNNSLLKKVTQAIGSLFKTKKTIEPQRKVSQPYQKKPPYYRQKKNMNMKRKRNTPKNNSSQVQPKEKTPFMVVSDNDTKKITASTPLKKIKKPSNSHYPIKVQKNPASNTIAPLSSTPNIVSQQHQDQVNRLD